MISVIVPVYNSEKYLKRCLDSIIKQTYKNIEIIVVNDGSTDESLRILEEYKNKYSNLKLVNQENKGQALAREIGLNISGGDYIAHVDSDDYIEQNYLEKLYNHINLTNSNICSSRIALHPTNMPKFPLYNRKRSSKLIDLEEQKEYLLYVNVVTHSKLYKRQYVINNSINNKINDDLSVNHYAYAKARKISFANDAIYHYLPNDDGLVSKFLNGIDVEKTKNVIVPLEILKEKFTSGGIYFKYTKEIEYIYLKNIFERIVSVYDSNIDYVKKIGIINSLFSYLENQFPEWQDNIYFCRKFLGLELPEIIKIFKIKRILNNYEFDIQSLDKEKLFVKIKEYLNY